MFFWNSLAFSLIPLWFRGVILVSPPQPNFGFPSYFVVLLGLCICSISDGSKEFSNGFLRRSLIVFPFLCTSTLSSSITVSSVWLLSHVRLFAIPWTAAHQASVSITNSLSFLKLMSIESVMPSNQLILCCSLLLLPSILPSIRVFSDESLLCNESVLHSSF